MTSFVGAPTVTSFGSEYATALTLLFLAGVAREGRVCAHGGAVLTVETDTDGVEQRLRAGALVCPLYSGVLTG